MYKASRPSRLSRYAVAVAVMLLATGIRWLLNPLFGENYPYITFFMAITISAWYGGFYAGLVSLIAGLILATYFFIPPIYSFTLIKSQDAAGMISYLIAGIVIILLSEAMHRARRIAVEAALAHGESEKRLSLALEAARLGTWEWNIQTGAISWSDSLEPLHGLAPGTFGGTFESFISLVHPEDRDRLMEAISRAVEQTGDYSIEFRIIWPDGSVHWIEGNGKVFRDPCDRPLKMIGLGIDITERRRGQEASAFLASLVESSEDCIIGKTLDGIILTWNAGAERLYGYTPEEVIGRPVTILTPEGYAEEVYGFLERIKRGEQISNHETIRVTKYGKLVDVALTISPIKGPGGEITGASTIARDITERKQAEYSLKMQARVLESMAEGVSVSDESGIILYTNPAEDEMFGYERGELIGKHVSLQNIYPAEENLRLVGQIIEELKTHGAWIGEFDNRKKDGTHFITAARITALSLGGKQYWVCVQEDITERKAAQVALEESERRFRQLAESIHEVFWMSDVVGREMLYISPAYEEIWGRTCESLYENPLSYLSSIHPEDRDRVIAAIERQAQGEDTDEQYRVIRPDGEIRWVRDRAFPIRDSGKQVRRVAGIAEDITELKRAEDERSQLLAREQHARAQAEAANRLKDEFLATVSHELRTPLNAILGWATMLRTGRIDPQTTLHAIEVIERNAKAQAQLIEDILDVSRIISGKLRLDLHPMDLTSVIEAAIDSVRPAAESKGIDIEIKSDESVGLILGDPNRLQQVVWNLLSNAIKFTPGEGRVEVRLERVNARPGPYAQIVVSDTGIGINRDFLPYVFERFLQADGTITRRHGGLGLGLAIVRHLVEMHGGTIKAESGGEGLGATFILQLPLRATRSLEMAGEAARAGNAPRSASLPAREAKSKLKGLTVLVVDDEPDTLDLLKQLLEREGARALTAASAAEALRAAQLYKPDVIVSDIAMPDEDGYSLINKLRTIDDNFGRHTPAIALTAQARREDRMQARLAGFETFVAKPFDTAQLLEAIASAAGRNTQSQPQ